MQIKRQDPANTGWELGLMATGSGRSKPPIPPPQLLGAFTQDTPSG